MARLSQLVYSLSKMGMVQEMSEVANFYQDQSVLITGATGFIGKALVEKLLYSCVGIKNVYVLIRPKNKTGNGNGNGDPENYKNRFQELLQSEAFERLKRERPDDLKKIIPVWGDLSEANMGISMELEEKLIEEITIVFHGAATVRFNEPLKVAVEINLLGAKNVLDFFKKLKNPQALVYISTAFANCHKNVIEETVYPMVVEPDFLLQAYSKLDNEAMDSLMDCISEGRPNTYTLTKAAAEQYLEHHAGGLPITIVRPSIVENALKEPSVGWRDCNSILSRCVKVIAMGLIHNLPVRGVSRMDVVPLDIVVNLIIVVAWNTAIKRISRNKLPVYNLVSGNRNPINFETFMKNGLEYGLVQPYGEALNHVYITLTTNKLYLTIGKYMNHYLPAALVDSVLFLKGQKPKYLAMYRRFFSTLPMQTFFMQRHFNFKSDNAENLFKELSPIDQRIFNFDVSSFHWPEYVAIMLEGMRRWNSPDDNKTDAKVRIRKMRLYYYRYMFMNFLLGFGILYLAYLVFL